MEIFLRTMIADDAETVTHLSKQLGYEISIDQTSKNIDSILKEENCEAFVAVHDKKVVGWITVAFTTTIESPPFCEIRGLVVDEQYRKNNIGKMLIEKVKQWCREKKCERLRLRCNVKRTDTHKFYLHLGFTEKKEQKVFEISL